MPSQDHKPHTLDEIRQACQTRVGQSGELVEVCEVSEELIQGIDTVGKHDKLVTVYGSARFDEDNHPMAIAARTLGERLVREAGFGIITGGGHGIMGAANKGAHDAGGTSIGATIVLPHEQTTNKYVNDIAPFRYFFTRKTVLRYASEIAVYFPGGFGTLDELMELLTLVQTNKIKRFPIILFNSEFWKPLDAFFKETLAEKFKSISPEDRDLYIITDSIDEIIEIAKKTPNKKSTLGDEHEL